MGVSGSRQQNLSTYGRTTTSTLGQMARRSLPQAMQTIQNNNTQKEMKSLIKLIQNVINTRRKLMIDLKTKQARLDKIASEISKLRGELQLWEKHRSTNNLIMYQLREKLDKLFPEEQKIVFQVKEIRERLNRIDLEINVLKDLANENKIKDMFTKINQAAKSNLGISTHSIIGINGQPTVLGRIRPRREAAPYNIKENFNTIRDKAGERESQREQRRAREKFRPVHTFRMQQQRGTLPLSARRQPRTRRRQIFPMQNTAQNWRQMQQMGVSGNPRNAFGTPQSSPSQQQQRLPEQIRNAGMIWHQKAQRQATRQNIMQGGVPAEAQYYSSEEQMTAKQVGNELGGKAALINTQRRARQQRLPEQIRNAGRIWRQKAQRQATRQNRMQGEVPAAAQYDFSGQPIVRSRNSSDMRGLPY